jgi:hypothetical protein
VSASLGSVSYVTSPEALAVLLNAEPVGRWRRRLPVARSIVARIASERTRYLLASARSRDTSVARVRHPDE